MTQQGELIQECIILNSKVTSKFCKIDSKVNTLANLIFDVKNSLYGAVIFELSINLACFVFQK